MTSRPISQLVESPRTHEICIPAFGFSRMISPTLFSYCSTFYEAYLSRADTHTDFTTSLCAHCNTEHNSTRFCLPYVYAPFEVEFLLDFIERTPQCALPPPLFISILRLSDYLMLNHNFIFDMIQLYIPRYMRRRSPFTEALVDALSHTAYHRLGEEFARIYFSDSS